ncbi:tetranectin-like [Lethenteron reissneri]|uniref:tetranectin-like n=1 Tax=Lethenteron reissneri TaxID=7753 RepID=UPI002AB6A648|nr:tetranectin-like [Lethenteron reissneri]
MYASTCPNSPRSALWGIFAVCVCEPDPSTRISFPVGYKTPITGTPTSLELSSPPPPQQQQQQQRAAVQGEERGCGSVGTESVTVMMMVSMMDVVVAHRVTRCGLLLLLAVALLALVAPGGAQTIKQRPPPKKATGRPADSQAVLAEKLARDIEDLRREVNALKEMQALHTMCLRGTKTRDNTCLLLFAAPRPFHEASEECFARGGQLALPADARAAEELVAYASPRLPAATSGAPQRLWLGASDLREPGGSFADATGAPLGYAPWADPAAPRGGGGGTAAASCVRAALQGERPAWDVAACKIELPFVCQFSIPA